MTDPDDLSAAAQRGDPCAVLHRALRFLVPLREVVRTVGGDTAPIRPTVRTLGAVLAAADRLRASALPVAAFNHDLWPYVTELADLAVNQPADLDYRTIAQYLPFVIEALADTCRTAGCGLPRDIAIAARESRRGVVTERLVEERIRANENPGHPKS